MVTIEATKHTMSTIRASKSGLFRYFFRRDILYVLTGACGTRWPWVGGSSLFVTFLSGELRWAVEQYGRGFARECSASLLDEFASIANGERLRWRLRMLFAGTQPDLDHNSIVVQLPQTALEMVVSGLYKVSQIWAYVDYKLIESENSAKKTSVLWTSQWSIRRTD